MRRSVLLAVSSAAATAALVAGGLFAWGDSDEPAAPTGAPFSTTPLSGYDTQAAVVTRGPFCEALDDRQVDAALVGAATTSTAWQNGDPIPVSGAARDVGQEFGCEYAGAEGTVARAWVFAPPVDPAHAQRLVTGAGKAPGCQAAPGPPFGNPTLALTCTQDGVESASFRGLFGDAWVVCEVVRPAGATWDAVDRAGRWCVGVLAATSG